MTAALSPSGNPLATGCHRLPPVAISKRATGYQASQGQGKLPRRRCRQFPPKTLPFKTKAGRERHHTGEYSSRVCKRISYSEQRAGFRHLNPLVCLPNTSLSGALGPHFWEDVFCQRGRVCSFALIFSRC